MEDLPRLLDVPQPSQIIFQHDGAPAHSTSAVPMLCYRDLCSERTDEKVSVVD